MSLSGERQRVGLRAVLEVWQPPYLVRTLAMTIGAFGTFALFYVAVNYIPSLFAAKSISLANAYIMSLVVTSSQIPGKLLNGALSEFLGRKLTYALFAVVASLGAYFFGQSSDPIAMMGWGWLFLFAASGSAPSYKMWYAEQYPTPIRAIGLSTCERVGGRLLGGVLWTAFFPVLIESFGIGTTMTSIAVRSGYICCGRRFCPGNRRPFRRRTRRAARTAKRIEEPGGSSTAEKILTGCPAALITDGAPSAVRSCWQLAVQLLHRKDQWSMTRKGQLRSVEMVRFDFPL